MSPSLVMLRGSTSLSLAGGGALLHRSRAGGCCVGGSSSSAVMVGSGSLLIRRWNEETTKAKARGAGVFSPSSPSPTGCSDSAATLKRHDLPWKKIPSVSSSSSSFSPLWSWARAHERTGASMFAFDRPTARFFSSKASTDPSTASAPSSSSAPSPSSVPEPEPKPKPETETKGNGQEGKTTSESGRLMNRPFTRRNRRKPPKKEKKEEGKTAWDSPYQVAICLGLLLGVAVYLLKDRSRDLLSLQELGNQIVEGKVEYVRVLDHAAKIKYVDPEATPGYIEIVSKESFYKSLRELEEQLGIDVDHQVPVKFLKPPHAWWIGICALLLVNFLVQGILVSKRAPGAKLPPTPSATRVSFDDNSSVYSLFETSSKFPFAEKPKVTFKDVAGLHEAKEEIMEFVDILSNPEEFHSMGAKCPKGLLLGGPPGTGKTLLAKAVAGEAGVNFLPANGSEFSETFVGLGSARVRDLFKRAKEYAPCIIYIDEIDGIGSKRGGIEGGDSEKDQTLNQLLVEMDGFSGREGVVVMASTNRVSVLDPALVRAGRFDRHIEIGLPDLPERKEILALHMKKLTLEKPIEELVAWVAPLTSRLSGADLANLCNEAAIHSVRRNADGVDAQDFTSAIDRVLGGIERKRALLPDERERVAYYEAGRVVVGWFLEHAPTILKVSITTRGEKSGYAQRAEKERFIMTEEELVDQICVALGGRAAEELRFGEPSSGGSKDLVKVTKLAYMELNHWGFSRKIGPIGLHSLQEDNHLRSCSEETAESLDLEARERLQKCFERSRDLLSEKRDLLEALVKRLLEKERLEFEELLEVLGPRPFPIDDPALEDYFKTRALDRIKCSQAQVEPS